MTDVEHGWWRGVIYFYVNGSCCIDQYANVMFLQFLAAVSPWLKHNLWLFKITIYKKKRYDRSDRFYCCLETGQFHVVLAFYVSKTKFACMHILNTFHVSGFKSEWHENFGGFHKTTCGFLSNPKAKITEFGDQQASKICVHTKYFLIRSTWATNLRGLGTPAGMLGSRRAPWNFP